MFTVGSTASVGPSTSFPPAGRSTPMCSSSRRPGPRPPARRWAAGWPTRSATGSTNWRSPWHGCAPRPPSLRPLRPGGRCSSSTDPTDCGWGSSARAARCRPRGAVEVEEGSWGIAVLSRVPLQHLSILDLGQLPRDPARRGAIAVEVEVDGRPSRVIGIHMSHLSHGSVLQLRVSAPPLGHVTHPGGAGWRHEHVGPTLVRPVARLVAGRAGPDVAGVAAGGPARPHPRHPRREAVGRRGGGAGDRVRPPPGPGPGQPGLSLVSPDRRTAAFSGAGKWWKMLVIYF